MSDFNTFLAEIPHEGDPVEAPEVSPTKQPPTEQPPAEESTQVSTEKIEEKKPEDKPVPFHKHPRWMRLNSDNKALRKELEDLKANLSKSNTSSQAQDRQVPPELQDMFGENADMYARFEQYTRSLTEKQFQDLLAKRELEQKAQKEKEEASLREYKELYEEQLSELGEEIGVALDDPDNNERNQILKIVEEKKMYDENGHPNFRLANEWRMIDPRFSQKKQSSERKRVAANTGPAELSDAPSTSSQEVMTPSKLKNRSFSSFLFN